MKFEDYKNSKPFKVPANYFEELNDNIIKMLPEKPLKKRTDKTIWNRAYAYIGYAAIFIIIFALGTTFLTNKMPNETIAEEYFETEDIDDILNNYPIDDYTFYCCLTGNDTNF